MIKDLGVGYGVFVRQESPILLKDNMLINVGEAYIVVNIISGSLMAQDQDMQAHVAAQSVNGGNGVSTQQMHIPPDLNIHDDDPSFKLKLKIFGGPSAGEIFYHKQDFTGKQLVIGRTPDCDIRINDKLLSKNQATIAF